MRTATWANVGIDVSEEKSYAGVLRASGLDYSVEKRIITTTDTSGNTLIVPGKAVVSDTGIVKGVVGDKYQILQNMDAFDVADHISNDIQFVKAGETCGGMVYIIAKLHEVSVLGDIFTPHLIFQNSHNGLYSLKVAICPLRMICQNQFEMSFRKTSNTISIRHTSSMDSRIKTAQKVLSNVNKYMEELTEESEKYAGIKLSDKEIKKILNEFFPVTEDMTDLEKSRVAQNISCFMAAYKADDNRNFRGTGWGMINAYSDFITHKEPIRNTANKDESRFVAVTLNPTLLNAFASLVRARAVA